MATAEKEKKHYWVDDEAQIVYAVIRELTAEEDATVERFKKYGYTIVNGRKPKDEKKKVARLDEPTIKGMLTAEEYETFKANKKNEGFQKAKTIFMETYPKNIDDAKKKIAEAGATEKMEKALEKYEADTAKMVENGHEKAGERKTADQYIRWYYWTKIFVR